MNLASCRHTTIHVNALYTTQYTAHHTTLDRLCTLHSTQGMHHKLYDNMEYWRGSKHIHLCPPAYDIQPQDGYIQYTHKTKVDKRKVE